MSFSTPRRAGTRSDDAQLAGPLPFHAVRIDQLRRICGDAGKIDRPLDLECWTSVVLGRVWARRLALPDLPDDDLMFVVGKPMLDACVSIGGRRGKLVLSAIARIDRGPLGVVAGALADTIPKARLPRWMPDVGTASIVRAFSARAPGDGEAILLQAQRGRNDEHMVVTWISESLGGIATWISLLRVVDPLDPAVTASAGPELRFSEVDPVLACRRVATAVERTDGQLPPLVGDGYSAHRALAIARVTPKATPLTYPVAS